MPPYWDFEGTTAIVRELEHMEAGGLTGHDLLRAATVGPAQWLGDHDRYGRLLPGMAADLIAMPADPSAGITALRGLDFVMKAGVIVRDDHQRAASTAH